MLTQLLLFPRAWRLEMFYCGSLLKKALDPLINSEARAKSMGLLLRSSERYDQSISAIWDHPLR